jgi:twinkle protein
MIKNGQPCIKCDSSDAMSIYDDGTGYCFSCKSYFHKDQVEVGEATQSPPKPSNSSPPNPTGIAENVLSRGLHEATLVYFGVTCGHSEETGEINVLNFPVYRDGALVGHKEKHLDTKQYIGVGSTKNPDFFGANKAGSGGKLLIVTEGEEDAMSSYQMLREQGKLYNVVSLPNGANSSAVKKKIEWLESFETIILNLDNDKIGNEAAKEIADIITPGKVKLMSLPVKDANEFLLTKKNSKEYLKSVYNARSYRPDGVVSLSDTWDLMWNTDNQRSILYPWDGLNHKLYGMREREIVTFTAGTGTGKSAIIRELEHHLLKNTEDNIGILSLEESVSRTAWGIVAVEASLPLAIREERQGVSRQDIKNWFDNTLGTGRIFTLDHFGSTSEANLLSRIRYMIKGLGCKWVVLDHLSIVVSAMNDMGDERKAIDSIMTKLRQLAEETGVGLLLVCHLRRVDGNKGHEQGIEVSLSHLRGSQAIAQLSDAVIALERNQQAETDKEANLTTVRVLKSRYSGLTGIATHLAYERATGRLIEIDNVNEYLANDLEY